MNMQFSSSKIFHQVESYPFPVNDKQLEKSWGFRILLWTVGSFRFKKVEKHWFNVKHGQFKQLTFHKGLIPVSNFTV